MNMQHILFLKLTFIFDIDINFDITLTKQMNYIDVCSMCTIT